MNVKEVVKNAIDHINDLFKDENISNLGLEEVEYDSAIGEWVVTVGFSRPWDYPQGSLAALTGGSKANRSYKIVSVNDTNGEVISVKNRTVSD